MSQTTITPPAFNDSLTAPTSRGEIVTGTPAESLLQPVQEYLYEHVWPPLVGISSLLSLCILVGILYSIFRVKQLRDVEERYYKSQPMTAGARRTFNTQNEESAGDAALGDVRWAEVQRHVEAGDSNSLHRAIMEADIMLDDAVTARGYTGDGVGEKMKQITRTNINSIDDAWEAHKIRNRIAHEGSAYELTEREARRAIGLYSNFFKEIGYIST